MSKLKERLALAIEEEKQFSIKLEENKWYRGIILSAGLTVDKNGMDAVCLTVNIVENEETHGKKITKLFVFDEKTPNPQQGKIGLMQLYALMREYNMTFETMEELALNLVKLREQECFVKLKQVFDKVDPTKKYNNYTIVKKTF